MEYFPRMSCTCLLVITKPFWNISLWAVSTFQCLCLLLTWSFWCNVISDCVLTPEISFFRMQQQGQGDCPRFLIVARRTLNFNQSYDARWYSVGWNSLFGIVCRVCHYLNKKCSLYTISALDYKSLCVTLYEFFVQKMVPHGVHELALAMNLDCRWWRLACLLLISASEVVTDLWNMVVIHQYHSSTISLKY